MTVYKLGGKLKYLKRVGILRIFDCGKVNINVKTALVTSKWRIYSFETSEEKKERKTKERQDKSTK
jgi:hypothetical protein